LCGAAQAQMRSRPVQSYTYLFAEFDHLSGGGSMNGGGLGAGWRMNRYFGLQAGGQYFKKSGTDFTNGYIEGLLHMPFTPRFSLYGSIGGAYGRSETSTILGKFSSKGSGYRAGVGMEYWMSPGLSLRTSFHRQNAVGVVDDISVGLGFRF
jgi:hypothetical protein